MKTEQPNIYWSQCPDTNRSFLCIYGVDDNIAEVFPVNHPEFLNRHEVAQRLARAVNNHDALLIFAISTMTDLEENGAEANIGKIVDAAREVIKNATKPSA